MPAAFIFNCSDAAIMFAEFLQFLLCTLYSRTGKPSYSIAVKEKCKRLIEYVVQFSKSEILICFIYILQCLH